MVERLSKSRLEAFSDGVIAVIITIMILELKVPALQAMDDRTALIQEAKISVVYLLSFVQVGIYWVNHHYLVSKLEKVSHGILWANLAALFGLSLIPFGLEWVGARGIQPVPVALYSFCFLVPAIAWNVLAYLIEHQAPGASYLGVTKQVASVGVPLLSIFIAFRSPQTALVIIAVVAVVWLLPPKRTKDSARQKTDPLAP